MDQLKDFLRQCVKYRFWIAFGVSILFPLIGYFVGIGAITDATVKREAEIKGAKDGIDKFTQPGIVNHQYQPIAATKKEALTKDVDATWRKLFALQEPLLKWPEEGVEAKFRAWGRMYPKNVDANQVQSTIYDYAIAYPDFVSRIYKRFNPFDFETGSGIVVAPAKDVLLKPAPFSVNAPPELGKVWAEQERLWVLTALLDVVAKVNDSVSAKDWDGAIIKQINLIDVGSQADQDQKSLAKGEQLVAADALLPDGVQPPAPAQNNSMPGMPGPGPMGMPGGMGGPGGGKTEEVFYLKTEGQQFKILPIKMTVLVEQAKLADFLVGLENSPMTIQVMETEISKPITPVTKPVFGDKSTFGMGGGMGYGGGMGDSGSMMMGGRMGGMMGGSPRMQPGGGGGGDSPMMGGPGAGRMGGMMGGPGGGAVNKGIANPNASKTTASKRASEKEAASKKAEPKVKLDQYYNVIEVTVYGQARFYLAPPAPPEPPPSSASTPAPDAPKAEAAEPEATKPGEPTPKDEPAKKDDTAKPDEAAKKEEAAKAEAPKAEAPKSDGPAPAPEAPKPDTPKAEAPKNDAPPPKS